MKTIHMKKSEKIGEKISSIFFLLLFLTIFSFGIFITISREELSVSILGVVISAISLLPILAFIRLLFSRTLNEIEYDEKIICLHTNEKVESINISEIKEFSSYYEEISSHRTYIGIIYVQIKTHSEECISFKKDNYRIDELKLLFDHVKEINPEIKDDFFKHIKFGVFEPSEGWHEYKKKEK